MRSNRNKLVGGSVVALLAAIVIAYYIKRKVTVLPPGTPSVKITITPIASTSLQGRIRVYQTTIEDNSSIKVSATVSGGIPPYTYNWTFGDGGSATGATATHQYTTPGNYTITVKVTDSGGASISGTAQVTVAQPLSIVVSPTATAARRSRKQRITVA